MIRLVLVVGLVFPFTVAPLGAQGAAAAGRQNEVSRLNANFNIELGELNRALSSGVVKALLNSECTDPSCESAQAAASLFGEYGVSVGFRAPSGWLGSTAPLRSATDRVQRILVELNARVTKCGCPPKASKEPSSLAWALGLTPDASFGTERSGLWSVQVSTNLPGSVIGEVVGKVFGASRVAEDLKTRLTLDMLLPINKADRGRVVAGVGVGLIRLGATGNVTRVVKSAPSDVWPRPPAETVTIPRRIEFGLGLFMRSLTPDWFTAAQLEDSGASGAKSLTEVGLRGEVYLTTGPGPYLTLEWSPGYFETRKSQDILKNTALGDPGHFHYLRPGTVRVAFGWTMP